MRNIAYEEHGARLNYPTITDTKKDIEVAYEEHVPSSALDLNYPTITDTKKEIEVAYEEHGAISA